MNLVTVGNIALGMSVTSKKTGYPGVGKVCIITDPRWQNAMMVARNQNPYIWDKYYPDWRDKPIIGVFYDEPRKSATIEELREAYKHTATESEIQEMYDSMNITQTINYPIDDLEIFQ